jgi:predicted acyltransferase
MTSRRTVDVSTRLTSLDAFRGATIAMMILVNTPGDSGHVYWPLEHAAWHGWTPTDTVFPSFLWIAGFALAMAIDRRAAAGDSRGHTFARILRRSAILFAIGVLLCGFPSYDFATLRVMGVLQRIAVCTVAGSAIWLTTTLRGRVLWMAGLLLGYWALMSWVPVPGFGAGRLDLDGNLAHYVDRLVLGPHNWSATGTWDPEGIVSTLPAIATMLFGMMAGNWIGTPRSLATRLRWLAGAGASLVVLGLAWHTRLPINKKLWTSSFSVMMAGLDALAYALVAWMIEGRGWRRGFRPLIALGMNALAIYVASELLDMTLELTGTSDAIYESVFVPIATPVNASLLYAAAFTGVMCLIASGLYNRRWFIRI